jgi:hypothetical protein
MSNNTNHVTVTVNMDPEQLSVSIYHYALVLVLLLSIGVYIREKMCPTAAPPRQQYQPYNPQYEGAPVTELMRLV